MNRPTDAEIEDQIGKAVDNLNKYPGMTYSEGVEAALRWVLGEEEIKPMD